MAKSDTKIDRSYPRPTQERAWVANTQPRYIDCPIPYHPPKDATGRQRTVSIPVSIRPGLEALDANQWARIKADAEREAGNAAREGREPTGAARFLAIGWLQPIEDPDKISEEDARKHLHGTGTTEQLEACASAMPSHAKLVARQMEIVRKIERRERVEPSDSLMATGTSW